MSRVLKPQVAIRAADIAGPVKLTAPARALLAERSPEAFVAQLMEKRLHADAVRFTAYRLPRPEAIWWGCLCLWEMARPEPAPGVAAVLQTVIDWLQDPRDERRRAAEAAANEVGLDTPAGALALAVFVSGGSLAPQGLPEVAADPHLTAKLIANALLIASRTSGREVAVQRQFLDLAGDVSEGRSRWQPARPSARGD
jgi:hypothetical protein